MNDIEADLLIANAKIKQLEEQLADYHHMSELVDGKMTENQRLRRINENLQSQLSASRSREMAAVEQIEQQMVFDAQRGCEPCEICANAEKTPCIYCKPKWRGPQEAEKGETE